MLTTEELDIIYEWGMTTELPYKNAPTAKGYSNQPIGMCWLKGHGKGFSGVRTSIIDDPKVIDYYLKMKYCLLQVLCSTQELNCLSTRILMSIHIDTGEYTYLS